MKIELKTLEDFIGYLKRELNNTDLLSKKAVEIDNKIIQTEDKARKLEK